MKIAIDCMGGDAPAVWRNVRGAYDSLPVAGCEIVLVGKKPDIEKELSKLSARGKSFEIVHTEEEVRMDEAPSSAIRKKRNSSLWMIYQLVKNGMVDGAVTAGNTGAAMAMAKIQLGMLPFVDKPAIAVPMPTPAGAVTLLDAGANVDCKPKHLFQFAVMGSIYSKNLYRIQTPAVGVLSIGEEDSKGNDLTREVNSLLRKGPLYFRGNVEGRDIFSGSVNVVVCDGFVGNIVLKVTESFAEILEKLLLAELRRGPGGRLGSLLIKNSYRSFKKKIASAAYGGAPLLGIDGVCVIAHGSSSPEAIKSAVCTARDFIRMDINSRLEKALKESGNGEGCLEKC